jgi:hypothetical protein
MATQPSSPTKLVNPAHRSSPPPTTLTDLPEELLERIFKTLLPAKFINTPFEPCHEDINNYVAVLLTSKQFHRIVLPLVKVKENHPFWNWSFAVRHQVEGWISHRYWGIKDELHFEPWLARGRTRN